MPTREFLALRRIAMAGVSRNPKDFSRNLFAELRHRGYDVVPVNPAAKDIDGTRCFASVGEITPPVEGVLIMTPAHQTEAVLKDCDAAGIRQIWLHRATGEGSVSPAALEFAAAHRMQVVAGECPYMFLPDTAWFHQCHRMWRKVTGRLAA